MFKHTSATADRQGGAAMIVGIVIITVLLLAALIFGYLALTQKPGPVLTADPVDVTADSKLTAGKSNNELVIDTRIIIAGVKRDQDEQAAAGTVLADTVQPVGDGVTASTTVESARLSQLQTEFISETDRRLKLLDENQSLANKLPVAQKPDVLKLLSDETTALTGLKAKAAAETDKDAFLADRDALDKEYTNFILALSKVRLLTWANDQDVLDQKVNVLGGKFQERLNDGSNAGNSVAAAQTALNSYQTNKSSATDATAKAAKAVVAVKPGSYEANRAVLKTYYGLLAGAHTQLDNASKTAQDLTLKIKAFKR